MSKYAIVTDSTAYLTDEQFEQLNIKKASLNVFEGAQTYKEDLITVDFVEDKLKSGKKLTTSQPAPGEFLEIFEELLEEGYEKIFVITLAKPLSGTYQSANLAKMMLTDPDVIHLFESKVAALGNELLLLQLHKMIESGLEYKKIVKKMDELIENSHLLLTLGSLISVYRSGRLSRSKMMLGTLLAIKPILHMQEGKLEIKGSERTHKRVYNDFIKDIKTILPENYKKLYVRIVDKNSMENCLALKEVLEATFENIEIEINPYLGPVFSLHVGTKGYGMAYTFEV